MIPYNRDSRQVVPTSSVKIIGLGGAGTNMLERIALDGMEGAELLALNTDVRTLGSCLAKEKIQLGVNLTKGLGAGGDPELGHSAVLESEAAIRAALKDHRIVFLCTGLGGGTGSGAAPIVTRIAREEGAFVVVFATMPFAFEGKRRRDQAETALNELAVLSNALVTFDNNRMGELVLAKQGIHEAFIAADHMICESIKAVIRLVVRPGLINVGLDDLMSALRTNRSRCLFGSGLASGKDRATKALRNALASPLLDQGALLKEAQTVLVHLSGGEDLTLFEIELLMQRLQKFVPETAHVLFGAAVDPALGDSLSLTLISALPEDSLAMAPRDSLSQATRENLLPDSSQTLPPAVAIKAQLAEPAPLPEFDKTEAAEAPETPKPAPEPAAALKTETPAAIKPAESLPASLMSKFRRTLVGSATPAAAETLFENERPFAEPEQPASVAAEPAESPTPEPENLAQAEAPAPETTAAAEEPVEDRWADEPETGVVIAEFVAKDVIVLESYVEAEPDPKPIEQGEEFAESESELESTGFTPIPRKRPAGVTPWTIAKGPKNLAPELDAVEPAMPTAAAESSMPAEQAAPAEQETPKLKLGIKTAGPQSELSLDSAPRGRFEGETPNVFEGEDLDLPPFLRKKK